MRTYAGLDISLAETSVCVLTDEGKIVFEGKCRSCPDAIAACLQKQAGGELVRVGLETGATSAWIWRGLVAKGIPALCLDARHAHKALSARTNKTDRGDAHGLAEMIRMGWFKEARVRSLDAQFVRGLLQARQQLLAAKRNVENQMRGIFKTFGTPAPTGGRGFLQKMQALHSENEWLSPMLEPLFKVHATLVRQIRALDKSLGAIARRDRTTRRLMTVPGVGVLTALAFQAEVDDPTRFGSSSKVGAYFGLTPKLYQSGEIERVGRISKTGDKLARSYLFEAAGVLISKVSRWSALKAWGVRLVKRIGMKRAKVAVARKLAVLLHVLWVDGTEFEWSAAT